MVVASPAATFFASTSVECLIDIFPSSLYGVPVFVGQGVYVGAIGSEMVGKIVMVGGRIVVANAVLVRVGFDIGVGVNVAFPFRASSPSASTEATPSSRIVPTTPPMTHGSTFTFFLMTSLKLGGTAIKTTVILSFPPR